MNVVLSVCCELWTVRFLRQCHAPAFWCPSSLCVFCGLPPRVASLPAPRVAVCTRRSACPTLSMCVLHTREPVVGTVSPKHTAALGCSSSTSFVFLLDVDVAQLVSIVGDSGLCCHPSPMALFIWFSLQPPHSPCHRARSGSQYQEPYMKNTADPTNLFFFASTLPGPAPSCCSPCCNLFLSPMIVFKSARLLP